MKIVPAMYRETVPPNMLTVTADYFPHSFVPGDHERHQPLILGDGNELEKRV